MRGGRRRAPPSQRDARVGRGGAVSDGSTSVRTSPRPHVDEPLRAHCTSSSSYSASVAAPVGPTTECLSARSSRALAAKRSRASAMPLTLPDRLISGFGVTARQAQTRWGNRWGTRAFASDPPGWRVGDLPAAFPRRCTASPPDSNHNFRETLRRLAAFPFRDDRAHEVQVRGHQGIIPLDVVWGRPGRHV